MIHALIVEDDINIARMVAATLALGNYSSETCEDGREALTKIRSGAYDLVLLDLMLPGLDGFSILEQIRGEDIPVIVLSAMQQVTDKVRGLRLGAEDYITKPFEPLELLARVEVILRRRNRGTHILEYGNIRQDLDGHSVTVDGKEVNLSPKEFDLLKVFLQHPNLALSRERLLSMVWGTDYYGETRTVDIHVQRLRQKLGIADQLVTLPRIGYRLEKKK